MVITTAPTRTKNWWDVISSRQRPHEDAFARLATKIATSVPRAQNLISRLERAAEAITELPGVTGAIVAIRDEGDFTLAYGAKNLQFCDSRLPLNSLDSVASGLPPKGAWSEVSTYQIGSSDTHSACARTVEDGDTILGMILTGFNRAVKKPSILGILDQLIEHFNWVFRDALRLEEMRLIEELRTLELQNLGRNEPIRPQMIAGRLKSIFDADAVTILVREHERLYLSATTDDELQKDVVSYEPGEGLTGFIASEGTSFRLRNALDPIETSLQSDGKYTRKEPRHPEAISETGDPVRLLGVPMRSGGKVRGVIRILRVERRAPFSAAEQNALQHFANLLGLAIHSAWRLHLGDSVMKAEAEAICITRNEPARGGTVPRMVYANRGAEILFGLRADRIVGRDARELYCNDEYEKVRGHLDRLIRTRKQELERILVKLKRFSSPEDGTRTVSISYRLVTSPFVSPETYYTVAVMHDITESQLQAERHKRVVTLLDKEGLAYFCTNEAGHTVESSPAESRLTGYSEEELRGIQREHLYYRPLDRKPLLKEVDKRNGRLVFTTQRLKRKDGSLFWAEGVIHLLKGEHGQKIGYEGLYEDVTERLRLQGFLDLDTDKILKERELYRELENSVRFQLLFMTSVSHQLRSPLGALVEQLENFQQGIVDAERFSSRLAHVIGQARVCSLLVANLTYMDRILRGESFDVEEINLAKLTIETKLNFAHLLPGKNLGIVIDEDSIKKNLRVWGHRELLRQVLVNLIDNAIKYSLSRTQIVIRGRPDPGGGYLQISNRGIPIPGEARKRIFERGFRTPEAESLIPAGTGLGLWLVRKICTAHNATIRCVEILEDKQERTAFQIFFPASQLRQSVSRRRFG